MANEEKKRRNQKLLEDYKSGKFTVAQLIAKYKVSQKRLYDIIDREQVRQGK
jgi:Mor family transcriptional regulator